MRREGLIDAWYDRDILAGDVIDDVIDRELENADLILLMVSPDFINSDYCVEREMQRAIERHEANEARVVPIIIEPCDWLSMPALSQLRALPNDGTPISEWPNPNNAYLDIVRELRRIAAATSTVAEPAAAAEPATVAEPAAAAARPEARRYRVERDFNDIDRSEFRDAAFETIKTYFRQATEEMDGTNGLRARFVDRGATSFGSTVVNGSRHYGTAHITFHRGDAGHMGDIYYADSENSPENTANGTLNISSDEYELFLTLPMTAFGYEGEPDRLTAEQAAEYLWGRFIAQAGITHA